MDVDRKAKLLEDFCKPRRCLGSELQQSEIQKVLLNTLGPIITYLFDPEDELFRTFAVGKGSMGNNQCPSIFYIQMSTGRDRRYQSG